MYVQRTRKRTYRKRTTVRKRPRRTRRIKTPGKMQSNAFLARPIVGFPPKMKMKMRYTLGYQPAIVASGTNTYYWNTNIADCDPLVAANQRPLYFNQMNGIYDRWYVSGFKYVVKIVNRDNDILLKPIFLNLQIRDTQSMDTNPSTAAKRWYDKDTIVGQGFRTIAGYVSTGQPYGYSKKKTWFDESFWGAGTTAPQNLAYLCLMLQNPSGTSVQFYMQVEITYYVTWMELGQVADST